MFVFSSSGSCEFNKEMQPSVHVQVKGVINTNQQRDQQQDYPYLFVSRNCTRRNPHMDWSWGAVWKVMGARKDIFSGLQVIPLLLYCT